MKLRLILLSHFWVVISTARAGPLPEPPNAGGGSALGLQLGLDLLVVAVVLGLIFYLRGLLQRRTSELLVSEARFRRLFEDAVEGIYENEPGGGFRLVNPALARILGYADTAELTALPPEQVSACYVSPTRRAEFFALLDEQGDLVTDFESEVRRKDGSRIWISENVRAVRDASGRLLHVQGLVTDITARKRAE
ncbi:MAG: PAS domain-containing protein, partial [Opitutales bacterium]